MPDMSRPVPQAQQIYRHFKGNLYQVVAVAKHTETGEDLVVYQALYGDYGVWCRPLEMFLSEVDHEKYPDAAQQYRFELFGGASVQTAPMQNAAPAEAPAPARTQKATPDIVTPDAEVPDLDPMVLEFLEADNYEDRLNIMAGLHHRITDDMITTMAIACDVEVDEGGDTESRFQSLKQCLLTKQHFESDRLR